MSYEHIREAAERASAVAEAEHPDEEEAALEERAPEPEPVPEPDDPELPEEPEQPQALTEAQIDSMWKSLEREGQRHAREVEKRAGPMYADLVPCPLCAAGSPASGFIFPVLPEPDNTLRRQAIDEALGGAAGPDYKQDPGRERCASCEGLGMLKTDSRVPDQVALPCRNCGGKGWREKAVQLAPPAPVQPIPMTGVPDTWGRPAGHPHWGQNPAVVGLESWPPQPTMSVG